MPKGIRHIMILCTLSGILRNHNSQSLWNEMRPMTPRNGCPIPQAGCIVCKRTTLKELKRQNFYVLGDIESSNLYSIQSNP